MADILVVGAGPTGLTLALMARALGASVRIVERRPEVFRPSRALIMHSRTLEVLRPLGVTEPLLARADLAPEAFLHLDSRVVPVRLSAFALPDTAFPHLALVRQMDVESVLTQALAGRGVAVERGTELIAACDAGDHACATLRSAAGFEQVECAFVAGCDGPESVVRRAAGISWHGGSYREEVVLADVELCGDLAAGAAHVAVGRGGLLFAFALGERATWRLLATQPILHDGMPFGQPGPAVAATDLQALLDAAGLDARITALVWSARYRLQHRIAAQFRRGSLFLAGDAAHAYSPATGQGMNTGIQDAINLGWKLAFAAAATDSATLLASYDRERRPAVREVRALTHLAFWVEASTNPLPSLLRDVVAPLLGPFVPALVRRRRLVAEAVRVVSQLRLAYRDSPLSVEGVPRLHTGPRPGRRLPDARVTCDGREVPLHTLLATPGTHILLHRDAARLERHSSGPHVTMHRLTNIPGKGMVAVRPDGYVGFRCGIADGEQLHGWLARIGAGQSTDGTMRPWASMAATG